MPTIDGKKFLTITAEADEIYRIVYPMDERPPKLNILNLTDGYIKVGITGDMDGAEAVNEYAVIPAGGAMNNAVIQLGTIHILAETGGEIVIERE